MERRFEIQKNKILQEAQIKPQVFNGMLKRLEQFAQPFVNTLKRREQKEHAHTYIAGLLSDLKRKNTESIAYCHDLDRQGLQRFIGSVPWAHLPLLQELARQVGEKIGEDDGVIVFDPYGQKKWGNDSVGVQRKWLGRPGMVDKGQVGVYMGYAYGKENALVDTRIYLPKQWAKDKARRKKGGVPKNISYQTRHELALDMLNNKGKYLPHAWIAGDDEMGRSCRFRKDLRVLDERYLLAVPSDSGIRDLDIAPPAYIGRGQPPKQPFVRVDRWRDSLSDDAWMKVNVRDAEKVPLVLQIAKRRVVA